MNKKKKADKDTEHVPNPVHSFWGKKSLEKRYGGRRPESATFSVRVEVAEMLQRIPERYRVPFITSVLQSSLDEVENKTPSPN